MPQRVLDLTSAFRCLTGAAVLLGAAPALASSPLLLPSTNSVADNGTALSITNTQNFLGGSNPAPAAIGGVGAGTASIGVLGSNTASGFGGYFELLGPHPGAGNSAVLGLNKGGNTNIAGNYGSAGLFEVKNPRNESDAVSISTDGVNSHALYVVNSGGMNGKVTYKDGDQGGVAAWFETTKPSYSSVLYSVNSADTGIRGPYGSAGYFVNTSTNNTSNVVYVQTLTSDATALNVYVGGTQAQGIQTYSYGDDGTGIEIADLSADGGTGIFAQSLKGVAAYFQSGQDGANGHCEYTGGPGWSCSSDRNLKKDFEAADLPDVLDRLDHLPVYYYRMKDSKQPTRYLGPTAQDFHAVFEIGENDTTINTANAQGVALAAAKALSEKLRDDEATIARQDARIAKLEKQLAGEQEAVAHIQQTDTDRIARLEAAFARLPGRPPVQQASAAP